MTIQQPVRHMQPEEEVDLRAFSLALDDRIAEMRRMLATLRPATAAGALRALRDAYPDVPLETRIRALDSAGR